MPRDIKTTLKWDGEKEYKQSISQINTGLKTLSTEMRAVSSEYKDNSTSIEALNAKSQILNQQYEEQQKKLKVLESAYKEASEKLGESDKKTQGWAQSVNLAQARLKDLERQIDDVQNGLDPLNRSMQENEKAAEGASNRIGYLSNEMKALDAQYANNKDAAEYMTKKQEILDKQYQESVKRVDAYKAALKDVEKQSGKNSEEYQQMESKLNGARAEMYNAENQTKDLDNESKGLGDTVGSLAQKFGITLPDGIVDSINGFGNFDNKVGETSAASAGGMESIVGSIGGVGIAAGAAAAVILTIGKASIDAALDVEDSAGRMKAALDLTEEEAYEASQEVVNIYTQGIVENKEEAEQALTAVMRIMGASGAEAQRYASKLTVINEVFGEDFTETARTASTMMHTFGITGDEALDVIARGLQTSANKNRDLLDVLNEYSPQYQRLGDDAETFLARIIAATDSGAFSADKAADAYKQFYVYAIEGNADFINGLDQLGLSAEYIADKIAGGGEGAQQALELVIRRLEGVGSTADQSRIAGQLFGTQWEDVGTQAILAMESVSGAAGTTTGTVEQAFEDMTTTSRGSWEQFTRIFSEADYRNSILPGIFYLINDIQMLIDQTDEAYASGYDSGKAIADGWTDGINQNKQNAINASSAAGTEIDQAARDALEEKSPSKKAYKTMEDYFAGINIGIEDNVIKATRNMNRAMGIITDNMNQPNQITNNNSARNINYIYVNGLKEYDDLRKMIMGTKGAKRARG